MLLVSSIDKSTTEQQKHSKHEKIKEMFISITRIEVFMVMKNCNLHS